MEENGIKMLPYSHSGQTVSSMQHGVVERLFFLHSHIMDDTLSLERLNAW